MEDIQSIYALKVEDNPTEEQIAESVNKQLKQLILIEKISKKKQGLNLVDYVNKTIEELEQEINLLNNQ